MKTRTSDFAPWNLLPYSIPRFDNAVHVYGAWIRMIQKDRNGSGPPELARFPARHAPA